MGNYAWYALAGDRWSKDVGHCVYGSQDVSGVPCKNGMRNFALAQERSMTTELGLNIWILIFGVILTLAVPALLSRISHWSYATCATLETQNELLKELIAELKKKKSD